MMKETMTAEEMFIELGFMFIYESDDVLEFNKTNKGGRDIVCFIKKSKEVECYDENEKDMSKKPLPVDGKLLLAIHQQAKELGWLSDEMNMNEQEILEAMETIGNHCEKNKCENCLLQTINTKMCLCGVEIPSRWIWLYNYQQERRKLRKAKEILE